MPILDSQTCEAEGILNVARLMLVSARTAPKAGGEDDVLAALVVGKEKDSIADEMDKIADDRKIIGFRADAMNLRNSAAAVLIGVRGDQSYKLDCGACGYQTCAEFDQAKKVEGADFMGPNCNFKILDLGVALGSAVKTASILNVDNRMGYRIGVAARRLHLLPEASIIMGLPISATSKSIYFDRPP